MIISGYPCIGKTTLTSKRKDIIDLDSICLNNRDGKKPDNWVEIYCNIAKSLSRQGYIVFVSSHGDVVRYFEETMLVDYAVIYPSEGLMREWSVKALERYFDSKLDKDYRAFERIARFYEADIYALATMSSLTAKYEIDSMDYDLSDIVDKIVDMV